MIRELYDQNIIIYVLAGLCGLAVMLRTMLSLRYKRLVKESDDIGATKNKALKHTKLKFEACYKLKIGVNNVDTFVDKNVYKYKFCGILLSTWENLCGQVLLLSVLLMPISIVFGFVFECGQDQILRIGAVGLLSNAIIIFVDKSVNISVKKRILKLNLLDYLDNFCKVRLEQEAFHPEVLEQYRRAFFEQDVNKQINTADAFKKDAHKDELNRRREARRRKEEERRIAELEREEAQRKLEEARLEEERRKAEERRQLAAKRREEERLKMEEEKEAMETRRLEMKLKSNEKFESNERNQQLVDRDKILHSLEEELNVVEQDKDMDMLLKGIAEIAAEKDQNQKILGSKGKGRHTITTQEEKIIEDVLREFFA